MVFVEHQQFFFLGLLRNEKQSHFILGDITTVVCLWVQARSYDCASINESQKIRMFKCSQVVSKFKPKKHLPQMIDPK